MQAETRANACHCIVQSKEQSTEYQLSIKYTETRQYYNIGQAVLVTLLYVPEADVAEHTDGTLVADG